MTSSQPHAPPVPIAIWSIPKLKIASSAPVVTILLKILVAKLAIFFSTTNVRPVQTLIAWRLTSIRDVDCAKLKTRILKTSI